MNENLFEIAVRNKMRFPYKGMITVEDLFDLNITQLDSIYKSLKQESRKLEETIGIDSLVYDNDKDYHKLKMIEVSIEIIKKIVEEKKDAAQKKDHEKVLKGQKQKILQVISRKQDQELENMSLEELQRKLNSLF